MMKFLALDGVRPKTINRLIQLASNDADIAKSASDDPNNREGQIVKALMMSLPEMPKREDDVNDEPPRLVDGAN